MAAAAVEAAHFKRLVLSLSNILNLLVFFILYYFQASRRSCQPRGDVRLVSTSHECLEVARCKVTLRLVILLLSFVIKITSKYFELNTNDVKRVMYTSLLRALSRISHAFSFHANHISVTECLYRHAKSRYQHGEDGMATPELPLHLQPAFTPCPPSLKSRSPTRASRSSAGSFRRSASAHSRMTSRRSGSVASAKAWTPAPTPTPSQVELKPQVISLSFGDTSKKCERAKSAPLKRATPKFTPVPPSEGKPQSVADVTASPAPPLRAQSAHVLGSRRSTPSRASEAQPCQSPVPATPDLIPRKSHTPLSASKLASRSSSAIPGVKVIRYPQPLDADVTSEGESEGTDDLDLEKSDEEGQRLAAEGGDAMTEMDAKSRGYDRQLRKYGWRMQVHGDPYNLK